MKNSTKYTILIVLILLTLVSTAFTVRQFEHKQHYYKKSIAIDKEIVALLDKAEGIWKEKKRLEAQGDLDAAETTKREHEKILEQMHVLSAQSKSYFEKSKEWCFRWFGDDN